MKSIRTAFLSFIPLSVMLAAALGGVAHLGTATYAAEVSETDIEILSAEKSIEIYSAKNITFSGSSYQIEGESETEVTGNVSLSVENSSSALTVTIDDTFEYEVTLSSVQLNNGRVTVNGCAIVAGMELDGGTLQLKGNSEIAGPITASESTEIISNGDLTVSDNLVLSGTSASLSVNGSLYHRAGYIKAQRLEIGGNYYGYSEDGEGNKLPGGYLVCETEYNSSNKIGEYTISGDCYLYNDIYSEFTEDENGGKEYKALKKGHLIIGGDLVNLGEKTVGCSMDWYFGSPSSSSYEPHKVKSSQNGGFVLTRYFGSSMGSCTLDVSEASNIDITALGYVYLTGGEFKGNIAFADEYHYSRNVYFSKTVTIDGNITAEILDVLGNLNHKSGVIKADELEIRGDYCGYSEDEQGNKLPGGYLVCETEYNSSNKIGEYTISGDCWLYNDIYSEFTEDENGGKEYKALKKGKLTIGGDLVNLGEKTVGCSMDLYFGSSSSSSYGPYKVISAQNGGFVLTRYFGSSMGSCTLDVSEASNIDITALGNVYLTGGEFKGNIAFADEYHYSRNVYFSKTVTIDGNITAEILDVLGNLNHKSGVIKADKLEIRGDYCGYSEDEQGNKLPGGYLVCETEYNSNTYSGDYTIYGDCYLYNDIYSEFTEDENGGKEYKALKKGHLIIGGDLVNLGEKTVGCSMDLYFGSPSSVPTYTKPATSHKVESVQGGGFVLPRLCGVDSLDVSSAGNFSAVICGFVGISGGSFEMDIVGTSTNAVYMPTAKFWADTTLNGRISTLYAVECDGNFSLCGDISNVESVYINGNFKHESGTVQADNITINGNCIGYTETNGEKKAGGYFLLDCCKNIDISGNLLLNNQYYSEELSQSADNLKKNTLYVGGDLINYADSTAIIPVNLIFDGSKTQNAISSNGGFVLRYVTVKSPCLDLSGAESDITLDSNNYEIIYGTDGDIERVIPRTARILDRNIVFDKGIGVEYLVRLSDNLKGDDSLVMKFEINGKQTTIPISEAKPTEWNNLPAYSFTLYIAAAEMTDVITAQIVSDLYVGTVYCNYLYSLCQYYLDNLKGEEMKPAIIAMLNYGTQAQLYFEHNTNKLANSLMYGNDCETAHIDAETLAPYKYSISGKDSAIRFKGYAISLKETMTAKLYFSCKEMSVYDFNVICDGSSIDPARLFIGTDENGTYLAVSAIAPGEYDKAFTVTVGGITISNLSIYSYLLQSIELEHAELAGIVDTLYAFNEAVGGLSA